MIDIPLIPKKNIPEKFRILIERKEIYKPTGFVCDLARLVSNYGYASSAMEYI